jgi:hypothetical protein
MFACCALTGVPELLKYNLWPTASDAEDAGQAAAGR